LAIIEDAAGRVLRKACSCRKVSPDVPFALSAGATAQELRLALRPTEPGRKQYVVHVVESRSHSLLASYLVAAVNRQPAVTKSFSLAVPAALGTNRKAPILSMKAALPCSSRSGDFAFAGVSRQPVFVRHGLLAAY